MLDGLTIRAPGGVAEVEALVELQQRVWGFPDIEAVPVSELTSINAGGGYVRQAELGGEGLVGFAYGYWTLTDGRPELYSRMLAVLPEHRGRGIGVALKLDQRDWTLAQGADRVRWTSDPLLAANARLNFGLLGCESASYRNNFYGERDNAIQRLMPTDRLMVEWPLAKPSTVARIRRRTTPPALAEVVGDHPAWLRAEGTRDTPTPVTERPDAPAIRVEAPFAIGALRDRNRDCALAWSAAMRAAMTEAFAAGYRVLDFAAADDRAAAGAYLLGRP